MNLFYYGDVFLKFQHRNHLISFLDDNEIITLKHEALNKNSFADGAIKAAIWLQDKPSALYSMQDIYKI
ncbi:MAG: hypothetical protein O7C60_02700 [Rickettsia endosymbiont of Ixodes persulcatus]|nr:hypothetical protein [Rickettsia endosymbiont of Ixodes persulcatus]MCZ6909367.1 hypothetical protein [Rickettsia endosymbiont of Ixodes persulcatus]MCZ6909626.1 hypothetical protein [Rickettsia endosymbiont of Ixodes persulcatus]MCZ6919290.1 hypothetical protein [Rickettsia endosymbiont of Ixodes persulcatus]